MQEKIKKHYLFNTSIRKNYIKKRSKIFKKNEKKNQLSRYKPFNLKNYNPTNPPFYKEVHFIRTPLLKRVLFCQIHPVGMFFS